MKNNKFNYTIVRRLKFDNQMNIEKSPNLYEHSIHPSSRLHLGDFIPTKGKTKPQHTAYV